MAANPATLTTSYNHVTSVLDSLISYCCNFWMVGHKPRLTEPFYGGNDIT